MSTVKLDLLTEHTSGAGVSVNKVIHAGAGINFGDQTLDYYEEGVFTAALTVASGTASLDASGDALQYVRIGRMVHVQGVLVLGTVTGASGRVTITLPFTASSNSTTGYSAGGVTVASVSATWTGPPVARVSPGSASFDLFEFTGGSIHDVGAKIQTGCNVYVSLTYQM